MSAWDLPVFKSPNPSDCQIEIDTTGRGGPVVQIVNDRYDHYAELSPRGMDELVEWWQKVRHGIDPELAPSGIVCPKCAKQTTQKIIAWHCVPGCGQITKIGEIVYE